MPHKSIVNKLLITAADAGISTNGTYDLFVSPTFNAPSDYAAGDASLELVILYEDNLPDPEQVVAKYSLSAILETADGVGNWNPFHYQFRPFVKAESGNRFIIQLSPNTLIFDQGVPIDIFDGVRTIASECPKAGRMPDGFRLRVFVNEFGMNVDGTPSISSFQSVVLTSSFRTF